MATCRKVRQLWDQTDTGSVPGPEMVGQSPNLPESQFPHPHSGIKVQVGCEHPAGDQSRPPGALTPQCLLSSY